MTRINFNNSVENTSIQVFFQLSNIKYSLKKINQKIPKNHKFLTVNNLIPNHEKKRILIFFHF